MIKRLLAPIWLSIFFSLLCHSVALAGAPSCAEIFNDRKSIGLKSSELYTRNSQLILNQFSNLSQRVIQAKNKHSANAGLYVELTTQERMLVYKTVEHSLKAGSMLLENLKTDARIEKSDFKKVVSLLNDRLSLLSEQIVEFKEYAIFKHAVELSNEAQVLLSHLHDALTPYSEPVLLGYLQPRSEDSFRPGSYEHLERILLRAIENENVIIPTELNLTVDDFLLLTGSGIAPAGMVLKPTTGDQGAIYDPHLFFEHDILHAGTMARPFNSRQQKYFNDLLSRVNLEDSRTKGLMKSILFFLTHERPEYGKDVLNISVAEARLQAKANSAGSDPKSIYQFMLKDKFFGIDSLQKRLPTEAEYEHAKSKLLMLMRETLKSA